jgi:hypothetical protein
VPKAGEDGPQPEHRHADRVRVGAQALAQLRVFAIPGHPRQEGLEPAERLFFAVRLLLCLQLPPGAAHRAPRPGPVKEALRGVLDGQLGLETRLGVLVVERHECGRPTPF